MTGWRPGYLATNEEIIKVISNIQSHATSNPNTISQMASIEALRGGQNELVKIVASKAFKFYPSLNAV